jgi:uncharacterized protein (DUF1684 family)
MYRFLMGIVGIAAMMLAATGYTESIRAWQAGRDAKLRSPDGWLSLAGLFWLKEGKNTIGSAEGNDFVLPKGSAAANVGTLQLAHGKVTLTDGFGKTRPLSSDDQKPDVVKDGSISFYVIQRGDKFAVRAKDSASPTLKQFTGMKYFAINPELHFEAKFIPDPKKIPILNIVGQTELQESPGEVEFTYRGQTYRLRPIFEEKTLFFLFKDATNHRETYQAGRMLNTPLPANGKVDLDFNRAYNPPCTFTRYATCPLPPKENSLPFAVTAGELRYGKQDPELSASR